MACKTKKGNVNPMACKPPPPPPPKKKCNMPLGLEDRRTSSKKSIVSQGGFKSKISNCTFKDYNLQNNFDITGQNK